MKRLLVRALIALSVVVASIGLAAPAQAATLSVGQYEAEIATLVNQSRASAGLSALTVSTAMSNVARTWSSTMASSGTFAHNPSYAAQIPSGWRSAAENIAYGAQTSGQYPPSQIHANFMASSGHRANILNAASTHIGIGVAFVSRGGYTYVYVTEDFGAYPASVAVDAPQRDAQRLAGSSRFETAVAIGKQAFPSSSEVVLVAGEQKSVVDGLVAGPFAYSRHAPMLLTGATSLGSVTRAELTRRHTTTAWLIGGTGVISSSVVTELNTLGISVRRLSGASRFGTAAAVARQMPASSKALVVSGMNANLIDAAAASGAAAAAGRPILLTDQSSLPTETRQVLADRGVTSVTVVGGTGAVSDHVVSQLRSAGMSTSRMSGSDRYGTAAAVASGFASVTGTDKVVVAGGANENLIDSMTGGTLGHATVLTGQSVVPSATSAFVAGRDPSTLFVVGGIGAVGQSSVTTLCAV